MRSSLTGRAWPALHIADACRVPLGTCLTPKVSGCWERGGIAFLSVCHVVLAVKGGAQDCACGLWPFLTL